MTIFAGIVALDGASGVPVDRAEALVHNLSRQPGDQAQVWRGDKFVFAQFRLPSEMRPCAHVDTGGSITLMAGRPLFAAHHSPEVEVLHSALQADGGPTLQSARGSYCAAHWDAQTTRLLLVADKLALRPIYFGIEQGLLFFSTALRILETTGALTQRMDVKGVSEIASFGYPLADRSPYEDVRALEPGRVVQVRQDGSVQSQPYWRWDRLSPSGIPDADLPRAVHKVFTDAIDVRLGDERRVVAGLSGGLDSRCLVAGLRSRGVDVDTINFAPGGSEDQALGKMAAQALGTRHFESPAGPLDFTDCLHASHTAWLDQTPSDDRPPKPYQFWSGDGGSCGMGHIYLNEQIIELMRQGRIDSAIDAYLQLNGIGLPAKLLARRERQRMVALPHIGVRDELRRLEGAEPSRRIHVYLMVNGQRRVHTNHYENIDLRRIELIAPFFDSDLVQLVLSSPIDGFLLHRFYSRWLEEFQPAVRSVPWQAYPGHVPSPLRVPPGLRNQWDEWYDRKAMAEISRRTVALADEVLRDPRLPSGLFNRHVLWLARQLAGLGFGGTYGHVIKCAATFVRYSRTT